MTTDIVSHVENMAASEKRPLIYHTSSKASKEQIALQILQDQPVVEGLICTLSVVEYCQTLQPEKHDNELHSLDTVNRKCKYYYFYFLDKHFGFMHINVSINGLMVIGAAVYAIVGIMILYSVFFILSLISIWTKRADFASNIFFQLWSFMRNPSSVYGKTARFIFSYIFPVILICSTPVEILLKKVSLQTLFTTAMVGALWFWGSAAAWKYAVRHYTSASS